MRNPDPMVSVLIRTLGRPSLATSVDSALRQTHRSIEIVIVNAGSSPLPEFNFASPEQIRVVEGGPRNRPQAANAGLEAAMGDWLVFLDDDDSFLPDHLESLLAAIHASGDALVAYSATDCVDDEGRSLGVMEKEFDRLKLFTQNYIQIGAALFSRQLVQEGYRFDESFECLQDWDFWIQLAQRMRFAYTGKATNVWSAHTGGSGCGMGVNSDTTRFVRYRDLLRDKWTALHTALHRKVVHHNALASSAMRKGSSVSAERHLAMAERVLRGAPRDPDSPGLRRIQKSARGTASAVAR